jgi:pilus assembly protein Flp/PilA
MNFVNFFKGESMNQLFKSIRSFAVEEDGAQVVEYALIIAVVSIALVIALSSLDGNNFSTFISRVGTCLTTSACV